MNRHLVLFGEEPVVLTQQLESGLRVVELDRQPVSALADLLHQVHQARLLKRIQVHAAVGADVLRVARTRLIRKPGEYLFRRHGAPLQLFFNGSGNIRFS